MISTLKTEVPNLFEMCYPTKVFWNLKNFWDMSHQSRGPLLPVKDQTWTLPSTHMYPHVCAPTHKCIHMCVNTHTPKITSMWSTYLKFRRLQFVTLVFLIYITRKGRATPSMDIIALRKYYILPMPTTGKITASENWRDFFCSC